MIAALLALFKKWEVTKAWPKPEATGDTGGISWRIYTMGSWQ
jgi:hypothetical protein